MSEGGAPVSFHDWRAARDKAATRRLWRSRYRGWLPHLVQANGFRAYWRSAQCPDPSGIARET